MECGFVGRRSLAPAAWAVLCAALLAGCVDYSHRAFQSADATLAPLEENQAAWPEAKGADRFPEGWNRVRGNADEKPGWVHARGYLQAPLARVWAGLRDTRVTTETSDSDEARLEEQCPADGLDYCLVFYFSTSAYGFTFEFEKTWKHQLQEGSPEDPRKVVIRYQLTWGAEVSQLDEGSFELTAVEDGVTSVSYVGRLKAWGSDNSRTVDRYARDLWTDLVAFCAASPDR